MDIVKAIYDMMGKYTYPVLREDTPRQHVDVFFQVPPRWPGDGQTNSGQGARWFRWFQMPPTPTSQSPRDSTDTAQGELGSLCLAGRPTSWVPAFGPHPWCWGQWGSGGAHSTGWGRL